MTDITRSPASRRNPALAALTALWRGWQREREFRAAVRTLHRLDDHLLRDIGVPRGDIAASVRRLSHRR